MKPCSLALAAAVLAFALPVAAQDSYVLDPAHSRPSFEARHLGLSTQFGFFDKVSGKATLDRNARTGTLEVTIETASIRTFDPRLDAAVKGEKYLNVEKFPTMSFKSTGFRFEGDKLVGIDGDLTMLGVAKPVSLRVVSFACGDNPFNKKAMCGGDAAATIKRSDWGMTQGIPNAPADEVTLRLPFEGYREQS